LTRSVGVGPATRTRLAEMGVLGMAASPDLGGQGFTQQGYCQVMEVLGQQDSSVAVFVNAHHSIGIRALVLFGTPEQKATWLPPLVRGEKLAAFALTEEQAGSDAANVQTTATPSAPLIRARTSVPLGLTMKILPGLEPK